MQRRAQVRRRRPDQAWASGAGGPRGPHLAAPAPSPASLQVPSGRRPVLLALTGCRDGLCSGLRAQLAFNLIFLLLNTQGSIRARTRTLLLLLSSFFFVFFSSARGK